MTAWTLRARSAERSGALNTADLSIGRIRPRGSSSSITHALCRDNPEMARSAATLAGRYRLESVIGRGGMSTVYRARDQVLGRVVAVKVLAAGLPEDEAVSAARFE